ncbi:MAG TPA: XTP/dITP diphosphatase [Clostridia bacterium]|nr:XTP/dITP diphosphatase [Clostridia bacterium]
MKLVLATNNKNKLREIQSILGQKFDEIVTLKDLNLDIEVEETGTTFLENAMLKANEICKITGLPALADDSGLSVDALDGAPGVYSARYAGLQHNDVDNNAKLLDALKNETNRKAHFTSAVVLCFPDGKSLSAEGYAEGEILKELRGDNGFGYDPLFYSFELKKTFAQATALEKNAISHRAQALQKLLDKLNMQNA